MQAYFSEVFPSPCYFVTLLSFACMLPVRIALLITLLLTLLTTPGIAQDYRADRPLYSISAEIVPVKTFAPECGHSATFISSGQYRFQYADLQVRIGMMKLMEMTVALESPALLTRSGGNLRHSAGLASPKLGLKILMKEKEPGTKMGLAFSGGASFNIGSKNFRNTKILPSFRIGMDIDWSAKTNMRINYGVVWMENRKVIDPEGNPVIDPFMTVSAAVIQEVHPKLSVFGEIYALVKYDNFRSDYQAHTGLLIAVKPDVQLDISGGAGLSPASSRGFVSIGFAGLWPAKNRMPTAENQPAPGAVE